MASNGDLGLGELPGFASLSPDVQALLRAAQAGEEAQRPRLLERVADVVNVFIALDLLQFVFMPSEEATEAPGPIEIDLLSPEKDDSAAIAWFAIGEAGVDEYRDAVTLFGDVIDVLNPPIVLDASDDDERLTPDD